MPMKTKMQELMRKAWVTGESLKLSKLTVNKIKSLKLRWLGSRNSQKLKIRQINLIFKKKVVKIKLKFKVVNSLIRKTIKMIKTLYNIL